LVDFTGRVALTAPAVPLVGLVRLSSRRFVLAVAAVVVLLRLTYLTGPLDSDEAGYLMVARGWRAGGPHLYGHYFVDRPPLLIALFRVADLVGWAQSIRVLASAFAVLLVVSAAWAAHQVAGDRGARWAALVGAAAVTTPLLMAQEADGEIFAAPLVMLAVALTLAAARRGGGRSLALAMAGGLSAGAAVMVKQNFADALVFAAVLLAVSVQQRRLLVREAARVAVGGVLGGALVLAGVLAYVAWSHVGLSRAWTEIFGFRTTALDVIEDHNLRAPLGRAVDLVWVGVLAGLLPLLVVLLLEAVRSRFRGPPVAWAVGATLLVEGIGIALGGSYWAHYLIQLAPMLALAAGLWAASTSRVRIAAAVVVASAVAATPVVVLTGAAFGHQAQRVGSWLVSSARPGDTATMLFGNADAQQASGMFSPYPQLWTLPMRTLDPRLAELRSVLAGPHAPTWVVVWGSLDPWQIDPHARTARLLTTRYRRVADVCGHSVLLRDGVHRRLAPSTCSP
jgi:4-amino-4-deoxy-L-arabinose transferase-like glycosyltransferase